jgi:hypothetical protein
MCGRGCDQDWDVRCCCELDCPSKNTNEQFYKCPMKLNTIHFHIGNDFIYYQYANSNKWDKIKEIFNLNDEEISHLKQWYLEDEN